MVDPQRTADKRLRHLLTLDGLPAPILRTLIEHPPSPEVNGDALALSVVCLCGDIAPAWQRSIEATLACLAHQPGLAMRKPRQSAHACHERPAELAGRARPGEIIVLAHPESGAAHAVAAHVADGVSVVNLLDGMHAAPIAALCDLATLWRRLPDLHTRSVLLRGDLWGDPRLRGLIHALTTLGVPQVCVVHDDVDLDAAGLRLGVQSCREADAHAALGRADVLMDYSAVAPGEPPRFHGLPAREVPERTPAQDGAGMLLAVFGMLRQMP